MYLYFLTVSGMLLFVFSLQYILYHNYYITLLLSGRNLSVKTTALSWSFQTLLLDLAGVCVWLSFYELCLLMVTLSGSNIWVTSQDSNFFLASWPQKRMLAFPSLEDCQCWPLGQWLALMLRPHWFFWVCCWKPIIQPDSHNASCNRIAYQLKISETQWMSIIWK